MLLPRRGQAPCTQKNLNIFGKMETRCSGHDPCSVRRSESSRERRNVAIMKARPMRKPRVLEPEREAAADVVASNHDIVKLLRKQEEVERYLEEIRRATASIEKILSGQAQKRSYEIRYVADIEDYYM
jgi:hypothetical protein